MNPGRLGPGLVVLAAFLLVGRADKQPTIKCTKKEQSMGSPSRACIKWGINGFSAFAAVSNNGLRGERIVKRLDGLKQLEIENNCRRVSQINALIADFKVRPMSSKAGYESSKIGLGFMPQLIPPIPQRPGRWLSDVITSNAPLTNSSANWSPRRDRGLARPIDIFSGLGNRRPHVSSQCPVGPASMRGVLVFN